MDAATQKFHNALPFVLVPADPALAALHVVRTRPQPIPHICSKCGSSLASRTRVVRSPHSRSIQVTCLLCQTKTSTPLDRKESHPASVPSAQPPQISSPVPSVPPATVAPSLARTAKKDGLQQMLQRNRERSKLKQSKQPDAKSGTLSAFLSAL